MNDDRLHDEIDFREELREKTRELVSDKLIDVFNKALDETKNVEAALKIVALWAENELADLTTEAVQGAYKLARLRNG